MHYFFNACINALINA